MSEFQPIRLLEIELGEPLPAVAAPRAIALVRLHTRPLGLVELTPGAAGLGADDLARELWTALAPAIRAHLAEDGLGAPRELTAAGLPPAGTPRCLAERAAFLESAPFISVIVSTRDRPQVLGRCLQSLLALEYPRYEIVLIDNAPSSDATFDLVAREYATRPEVRYIREDRPGLSRARNRGVREARGAIVAFTDDDVVVDRHWLSGLARGFTRAPHAGCVTGLVMPLELATQPQVWFEEFGGFGKGCQGRIYDTRANRPAGPLFPYAAGQFGSGNNMAFRVEALRAIGGFDTALGAGSPTCGGEDLAAFVAVLRKGYALVYEPAAIVHHQHRRDYAGLRKHIYDCGVGLTAYLTQAVAGDPRAWLEFAAKVPHGLAYALSDHSPKNRKKHAGYPPELTAVERRGMLLGPLAYARARWSSGREEAR